MNHITQTFTPILSRDPKSLSSDNIVSLENETPASAAGCGSWRSKLFAKVKGCRDVVKSMMIPDRQRSTTEDDGKNDEKKSECSISSKTPAYLIGNLLRKSKTKSKETSMRFSTLNVEDEDSFDTLTEPAGNTYNLPSHFLQDKTTSDSLQSFLTLEQQINEEIADDAVSKSFRKKISAEPFVSYVQGSAEFVWSDEGEFDFSGRDSNYLERLDSSDTGFGDPRTNSTFCEESTGEKRSIDGQNFALKDSGFDNNFSM